MRNFSMTINGEQVSAAESLSVINPATEEAFARCALGSREHVELAVQAASRAFKPWSALEDSVRVDKINALASLLEANMAELTQLVTQETGKPVNGLNGIGSIMEVGASVAWTQYTGSLSLSNEIIEDSEIAKVEVVRQPLGVVASITPWNWPLMIAIWHVIPALRAGNTVVMKPSPLTPIATLRFVELANSILPPGVLNVITGDADVGETLVTHPGVSKIVFTGSTQTGKHIMQSASASLKRLTLELGGNDAGIVFPDAKVENIAEKLFTAAFHNNGQTCACLKRLYVHESLFDDVCIALTKMAQAVKVGDGMLDEAQLGPLQNEVQFNKVCQLVQESVENGATVLAGGKPIEGKGYFFEPTILIDVHNGMPIVDEEQFGPVLPIIKYSDIEQAIQFANASPYGLGASLWTSDVEQAQRVAQDIESGSVWINDHGAIQPNAPFGGVKQSGLGVEFGEYGLHEYVSLKTVKVCKA
ncbi:aldehyde dehydrogenase [Photobacterium ganghwense]|uniref:Aldehyde dehydrogenase n=1 Tax=Photobacterium ganghwense TaxID=320778 RepID=A0A0J1K886_9GAMM|nr:aldehyde dehydrogenase family protein [Photobacterium ganghwense]KLV10562.1 aldehyde dehydrogenase [Photobacterium ganghwense]PSU09534.1 aldehyde dehydrogenase [Photobacterium ganghwense]